MVISSNYTGLPDCQRNSLVVFGCTVAVYVFGIILLLLIRFVKCRWALKNSDEDSLHKLIRSRQLRWFPKQAEALLTGKTIAGKLLIFVRSVLYCLCSAIYLFNTYSSQQLCIPVDHRPQFILELSSNFVFLLIFILKVIASKNLLSTWLSMDCIIDHCTIIPCILALVFGFYQYGFGFLYFTRVVKAMEFLLLLKIVDKERSMRKLKIISNLLAAWLTLAGVFLLLERIGNFWQWRGSQQNLDYFDCVYFLLVTVSTVGYGDIVCTSYLGRLVTIIVIIGALISITTHVSELYELFFTTKRYCGTFNNEYHPRHVLVCGAINHKSVSRFLDAFVRADLSRFDENIMTVFLSTQEPDLRLKALLKREQMHATYLKGDATSPKDLKRAKAREAEAVIILTDPGNQDHSKEDWDNIMRVVSVKNLYPTCRILCMLNMMENKALMSCIPGWQEEQSDRAICTTQIKLGLLSLNCLVRGISTLLTNLVVHTVSPLDLNEPGKYQSWIKNYFRGTQYSMYTVKLSSAFDGMSFQDVVRIAMRDLRVIVVAVQLVSNNGSSEQVIVNPGSRLRINSQNMRAVVIADNFVSAQHLRAYCINRLDSDAQHSPGRPQLWNNLASVVVEESDAGRQNAEIPVGWSHWLSRLRLRSLTGLSLPNETEHSYLTFPVQQEKFPELLADKETTAMPANRFMDAHLMLDSTGLFYWVNDRPFTAILLTLENMSRLALSDHILVCVTKQDSEVKIGLANFVMPLRSTRIPKEELKSIVFLCDEQLVMNEWYCLKNFPHIYMLSGSPLSRVCLRAAGVLSCSTCVVISCNDEKPGKLSLLSDKETILCSLIIRSILSESNEKVHNDKRANEPVIITALANMESMSLLSITNECTTKNGFIRLSPHYMAGSLFASPVLNNLASNVFFDPAVLTFLETVLLGSPSHEVEKVFAEDSGFSPGLRGQPITTIQFSGFGCNLAGSTSPHVERWSPRMEDELQQLPLFDTIHSAATRDSSSPASFSLKADYNSFVTQNNLGVKWDVGECPSETNLRILDGCCEFHRNSAPTSSETVLKRRWDDGEVIPGDSLKDTTSNFPQHFCVENKNLSRNCSPLERNSFLSYATEDGSSVKVRSSRFQLLPLTSLGCLLNELLQQDQTYVTFGLMFDAVLTETGTICIGLYRCITIDSEDSIVDGTSELFTGGENVPVKRYVYTFPDIDTRIHPDDLVYCFSAISEET